MTQSILFHTAVSLPSSPSGVNRYCDHAIAIVPVATKVFAHACLNTICLTDTIGSGCPILEMFPITTKPKAPGMFEGDALYMKRDLFVLIINVICDIFTQINIYFYQPNFGHLNIMCMNSELLNFAI